MPVQPTKEGEAMITPSYPTGTCPHCGAEVQVYHLDRRVFTHRQTGSRYGLTCPGSGMVATA